MPTPKRVTPWFTLSVAQTKSSRPAGFSARPRARGTPVWRGARGTRWMVACRLLAYFSEHAFSHWFVGRSLGICFTGYGLHGTSHPRAYPPGVRWVFSRLPLLSARVDPASLRAATPAGRAAMYAAGTAATVVASVAITGYCWRRDVRRAQGFFVRANLWSVPLLLSESLRAGGDLRRAPRELAR
jgi:hypothetical protein